MSLSKPKRELGRLPVNGVTMERLLGGLGDQLPKAFISTKGIEFKMENYAPKDTGPARMLGGKIGLEREHRVLCGLLMGIFREDTSSICKEYLSNAALTSVLIEGEGTPGSAAGIHGSSAVRDLARTLGESEYNKGAGLALNNDPSDKCEEQIIEIYEWSKNATSDEARKTTSKSILLFGLFILRSCTKSAESLLAAYKESFKKCAQTFVKGTKLPLRHELNIFKMIEGGTALGSQRIINFIFSLIENQAADGEKPRETISMMMWAVGKQLQEASMTPVSLFIQVVEKYGLELWVTLQEMNGMATTATVVRIAELLITFSTDFGQQLLPYVRAIEPSSYMNLGIKGNEGFCKLASCMLEDYSEDPPYNSPFRLNIKYTTADVILYSQWAKLAGIALTIGNGELGSASYRETITSVREGGLIEKAENEKAMKKRRAKERVGAGPTSHDEDNISLSSFESSIVGVAALV